MQTRFGWVSLREGGNFEDVDLNAGIILKWILKKYVYYKVKVITRLAEIQTRYLFIVIIFANTNLIIPFVSKLRYCDITTFAVSNVIWRRVDMHTEFGWVSLREGGNFEDVDLNAGIILKWILKKYV